MLFDFLDPLKQPLLDSVATNAANTVADDLMLDSVALNSEIQSLRTAVIMAVIALADSVIHKDLEEDELPSDRLDALIAGIAAGGDDEGEFEVDESTLDIVIANFQDALATLGVDDGVIASMFGGDADADEAIEAAAEIIESNKPSDDDMDEFVDLFVYGEAEDDEVMLDGVSLGKTTTKSGKFGKVVYKAVKAIRNGKVSIVNKRVSGKVKLSAKQRAALNK
ncbi:MAG: hypothetical protein ACN6OV_01190, partial [Acinetobacter sp.]|uniref:hypothetical protein n=1 Tax=Acinetobacter sp. TaxID=472 RepID=UPI003D05700B